MSRQEAEGLYTKFRRSSDGRDAARLVLTSHYRLHDDVKYFLPYRTLGAHEIDIKFVGILTADYILTIILGT